MMSLLAKEDGNNKKLQEAVKRMTEQLKAANGQFTFDLKFDAEGWIARCREFDGIVTGGTNRNPTEEEVMRALINAIKTAFHIPITKLEIKNEMQQFPKINLVRELQFA